MDVRKPGWRWTTRAGWDQVGHVIRVGSPALVAAVAPLIPAVVDRRPVNRGAVDGWAVDGRCVIHRRRTIGRRRVVDRRGPIHRPRRMTDDRRRVVVPTVTAAHLHFDVVAAASMVVASLGLIGCQPERGEGGATCNEPCFHQNSPWIVLRPHEEPSRDTRLGRRRVGTRTYRLTPACRGGFTVLQLTKKKRLTVGFTVRKGIHWAGACGIGWESSRPSSASKRAMAGPQVLR